MAPDNWALYKTYTPVLIFPHLGFSEWCFPNVTSLPVEREGGRTLLTVSGIHSFWGWKNNWRYLLRSKLSIGLIFIFLYLKWDQKKSTMKIKYPKFILVLKRKEGHLISLWLLWWCGGKAVLWNWVTFKLILTPLSLTLSYFRIVSNCWQRDCNNWLAKMPCMFYCLLFPQECLSEVMRW